METSSLETIIEEDIMKWNRIVVSGDVHMGIQNEKCLKILTNYIIDHKTSIKTYVDIGDGVDNPFMSKYPVKPSYIMTAQEEFDLFAEYLASINKIIPRAKKVLIAGNHDKGRLTNSKMLNRGIASLRNTEYENVLKEAIEHTGTKIDSFVFANGGYSMKVTPSHSALFLHGDPSMDNNIKGGVTGLRRTGESYPFDGNIYMGHSHWHVQYPRTYPGKHIVSIGCLADTEKLKEMYLNMHPYENGFGVIKYNIKADKYFFEYVPIVDNVAIAEGKVYKA